MKWVVVLACAAGVARADRYPETFVDRPLVKYAGMTSLDLSEDLARYTSSGTRYDSELDVFIDHSWGLVEVSLHLVGITATADVAFPLGCDDSIAVAYTNYVPQTYLKYGDGESLHYVHKALVLPHALALYETVDLVATEESLTPAMARASAGTTFTASLGASAQVQLARRLAIDFGGGASFPVIHSTSLLVDPRASGDAYAEIVQTIHAWDFYANIGIGDLTGTRYAYGSLGFVHRWGG